jgi:hypothetical protein
MIIVACDSDDCFAWMQLLEYVGTHDIAGVNGIVATTNKLGYTPIQVAVGIG